MTRVIPKRRADAIARRIVAAQSGGTASFPNRIARKVLPQMSPHAMKVTATRMLTTLERPSGRAREPRRTVAHDAFFSLDNRFGGRIFRLPHYSEGEVTMPVKAPKQTATRLAEDLLGLLPRRELVWGHAVRAANGGSVVRMKVLGMISRGGPTRSGELAVFCSTTPSTMTEIIEGLVDDGYVRRDPDPTDRRAVLVAITAPGQVEVDRVVAAATAD